MLRQFENIFGKPDEVLVCFGDWEQKRHMKFKEPTKGKGMRTLFRRHGYQTFLVDEHRTSCKCSECERGDCVKFMPRENPRPWRQDVRLVHGLLSCTNCGNIWNRDTNGAKNIHKIAYNAVRGLDRPAYLCRGT